MFSPPQYAFQNRNSSTSTLTEFELFVLYCVVVVVVFLVNKNYSELNSHYDMPEN